MAGQDDLIVTVRVFPDNRQVYETLLDLLVKHGQSAQEINDMLFNIGLTHWVSKISEDLAAGPEAHYEPDE